MSESPKPGLSLRAKLLLLVVDYDQFRSSPAELLSLARSGGVFYGGLILALAFVAILLASINVFGGFAVTRRMLSMFSK